MPPVEPSPAPGGPGVASGPTSGGPVRETGPAFYRFQLFVAGDGPLSARVRENFARHIAGPLGDRAEVEVTDLVAHPRVARREGIVATPTLVRLEPAPAVRLVGDLTDFDRVRSLMLVGPDRPAGSPPTAG